MRIQTVLGSVEPSDLGVTLIHEHLLCDLIGADRVGPHRYNAEEVFEVMLPYLLRLREAGGQTLVDCTPKYLGRDVGLLRRFAQASGLHIITAAGLYKEPSLPESAIEGSAESIAEEFIREAEEGIEGTDIRPGLIKIAMPDGPLDSLYEKIVRAAAITHLRTGLTIAAHTGEGRTALQELETLAQEGVAANAFIWVHADTEPDSGLRREAASRGAWIEIDGIGFTDERRHIAMIHEVLEAGLEERLLISQDAGWYTIGEPRGGAPRPYEKLLTHFLPALEVSGVARTIINNLITVNPRRALIPSLRRA